jgi:hypothetical protein
MSYFSLVGRSMPAFGWVTVTVTVTVAIGALAACRGSREPAPQEASRSGAGSAGSAARPVNLLTAEPTIVAVSSTVANAAIVPAHLVDGDLGTAWNSRTGELQGAWIGARVPADARVTAIRMTVGFTRTDPKLGDLFTMNPRIRKVRVLRDGAPIAERTFDLAVRTLQDIPIDRPGGEYRIEVVEVVPGTKLSWREVCVSELEIWGTPGASAPPPQGKSDARVVRVGSFDPPPAISSDDCIATVFPTARAGTVALPDVPETIGNVEVLALGTELAVCRIEHTRMHTEQMNELQGAIEWTLADTTVTLAPIMRTPRFAAGERIDAATNTEIRDVKFPPGSNGIGDMDRKQYSVAAAAWQLTATEQALLVDVTERTFGTGLNNNRTTSTLYRVSASRLTEVLSYESSTHFDYEVGVEHRERCRLAPASRTQHGSPTPHASPLPSLVLTCERTEEPASPGAGSGTTTTQTTRYVWSNGTYRQAT